LNLKRIIFAGFRKAHMRAFIYNSCRAYCNKMRAHVLYESSTMSSSSSGWV